MTNHFILFFLLFFGAIFGNHKYSSAPYISGDTFKAYCDFAYDGISKSCKTFNPSSVKDGDTIFIKTDYLYHFFPKIHPRIQAKYIIVTHNSDYPVPWEFARYLDDEKIIAWFGINVENSVHPKLHPIPIGLANKCWPHGNVTLVKNVQEKLESFQREILLYMNIRVETNVFARKPVAEIFMNKPFCKKESPDLDYALYLEDLAKSRFVLSPRGNGLDCHRTWEALLMGAYPIVKSSSLDSLYEGLPVVIVDNWEQIDEEFLQRKYEEFQSQEFQMERIYIDYWINLISTYKHPKK